MSLKTALAAIVIGSLFAGTAQAQTIIERPGRHPSYRLELEPHGLLGPGIAPGDSGGVGLGAGLRATIVVAPRGFVPTWNDTFGIGFGGDWLYHVGHGSQVGQCTDRTTAPNGTPVCTEVEGMGRSAHYFYVPVVAQWALWIVKELSVFLEAGLAMYIQAQRRDDIDLGVYPVVHIGGRWHFAERIALTARLGIPAFTLGVSFLL
ncbi:MAG: hypothetical protein AAGF12_11590 [Myxococcota bacterium]